MKGRAMKGQAVLAICAALAGFSLWVAAQPVVSRHVGLGAVSASGLSPRDAPPDALAIDLAPVLDFAPFGQAAGLSAEPVAMGEGGAFVLMGITLAVPPSASRAILSGGDEAVANYGVGDRVAEGVTLAGVFADHVILNVAGQDQVVAFAQGEAGLGIEQLAEPVAVATVDADLLAAALAPQGKPAAPPSPLGRYRAEILQDPAGLVQRLGLEVRAEGYFVSDLAVPEILAAGLRPGDLIESVNAMPLGDPAGGITLFDAVAAAGYANVSVQRDGQTLLMTFPSL